VLGVRELSFLPNTGLELNPPRSEHATLVYKLVYSRY
jgi:hypothetical protein